jgi:hypothetical protein
MKSSGVSGHSPDHRPQLWAASTFCLCLDDPPGFSLLIKTQGEGRNECQDCFSQHIVRAPRLSQAACNDDAAGAPRGLGSSRRSNPQRQRKRREGAVMRSGSRRWNGFARVLVAASAVVGFSATGAVAAPRQNARLVSCAPTDCLLVSGRRADADLPVFINGHLVQAQGGRHWKVLLPVETVRAWSMPGARSIDVTTSAEVAGNSVTSAVKLPVGMLGSITELASLVILAR